MLKALESFILFILIPDPYSCLLPRSNTVNGKLYTWFTRILTEKHSMYHI